MAFVITRPGGRFELRESRSTPRGSRSRTLATFRVLDEDVIDHAAARAELPFDRDQVLDAARRAGAPIAPPRIDLRVGEVLIELDNGRQIRPGLRRLLAKKLAGQPSDPADHHLERMLRWMPASPEERGIAIRELLQLVDAYPHRDLPRPRFPHLSEARHG